MIEPQKISFLQYLHETHPRFFRRTNRVAPGDINYFTRENLFGLFETRSLQFFPQFRRKVQDRIAAIETIRDGIAEMTRDLPINRASRIIALYAHGGKEAVFTAPRRPEQELREGIVKENPCFPIFIDQEMHQEDERGRQTLAAWWKAAKEISWTNAENVPALEIDEEGSKGMTLKWLTQDNLDASPGFCIREVLLTPGGFTPRHSHNWEHHLFILEGKGRIVRGNGAEEIEVRPGRTLLIPPHLEHQIFSDPDAGLRYLDMIPSLTSFFGR